LSTTSGYLDLVGVTKNFGDTRVLHGLDVSIAKGEFISLIGPSGSGKTTTLRLITGTDQPTTGSVRLDGEDITFLPPHKREFSMVFQHFALFPHKNVRDNVAYGLQLRKVPKAEVGRRVDEMLDLVHMGQYAARKIDELSGGQRQRVAIARALAVEPRLVLLDEPTGALDAKLRLRMQGQLKELHRELGQTFIHVTHNQSEALALADRVFVMNEGRVEQSGPPAEVFNAPRTRFVAEFVGRNNLIDGTLGEQGFVAPGVSFVPSGDVDADRLAGPCTAVVRSDQMVLGDPPDGAPFLDAELLGLEYGGSTVTWVLRAGETQLQLDLRAEESGRLGPSIGRPYRVWWAAADAHLLSNA